MPLLTINDLRVSFFTRRGVVRAVRGVSLSLDRGESLGIVGESGCGKSVCCSSITRLLPVPPARVEGGSVVFDGIDVLNCAPPVLRAVRGRRIGMVFQDPLTSLNPFLRIEAQVTEALRAHGRVGRAEARRLGVEALTRTGIADAERILRRYPHELSGGMRQRVMIAGALIARPDLLIADEPTTALDVTVQAQILDIIGARRREESMAVVLITHDLGIAARACDRVAVMYAGTIVETAPARALFASPRHPYTRALERSIPAGVPRGTPLTPIEGRPPDLTGSLDGCAFAPRCAHARPRCRTESPRLVPVSAGHATACLRVQVGELEDL